MANEKLISELREIASQTPPICTKDKPEDVVMFGNTITIHCKPFEQFQELLVRAADALEVDAVEVKHGRWEKISHYPYYCSCCGEIAPLDCEGESHYKSNFCPNCGAKMNYKENEYD